MADSFGLKIGLEGEKEFKSALSDINNSFKVLKSEMNLVSSEFDKNNKSVEALTARNTVLGKEIDAQKQKIETLRAALANAAESFGENDRRTQNWQVQLNNAEAALNSMEREVESNSKAIEQADGSMDDASKSAGELADSVDDAGNEAKDASTKFEGLGNVCKAVGVAMAAAFTAVAAASVAAGKALVDMTVNGAAYADTVLTESTVTGIATDKLQGYMYAAELVDVSTDTLTKSMAKQIKSMKSAADGSKSYTEAYKKLGVSVTDTNGNLRDSDEVYWELIDALGKVENETERDALGMTLLGKSAQELNPLIEAGADRMQELSAQAEKVGYVLSEDMLAAYGALDDNIQFLKVNAEGCKNALGTVLLPVLTELAGTGADLLGEFSAGVIEANGDISKIADVIGEILPKALDAIMQYVPTILSLIGEVISSIGKAIIDNLPLLVEAASQIIVSILTGLISALPQIAEGALQLVTALAEGIMTNLPLILTSAVTMVATLVTGIGETLPELIPMAVEAVTTLVQGLVDNLPMLLDAALQLIEGLAQGLLDAIPVIIDALPEIINSIVTFLLDSIPEIIDTGIKLLTSLVESLPEIITAIVAAIPEIISNLVTAILDSIPQIIDAGVQLLISLIQNLPQIITTVLTAIPQIISSLVTAIIGSIPQLVQAGVQLFVALIQNLPTIIVEIVKAVPQIITGLVNAFTNSMGRIVMVGENIVRGLWQGIQQLAGWLWDKVSGWISSIWDGICDFFGIASPSKQMAWIGQMLVTGLSDSIADNGEEAVKAAEGLSADIEGVMNGLAGDMQTVLPTDFSVSGSMNGGYGGVSPLGISINIESLAVREEADINRIAQQLYQLEQRALRKKGLVYA